MFVDKEFRGGHYQIAAKLLDCLEEHALDSGIETLYLGTVNSLHAAIRFYEKRCFSRIDGLDLPKEFPKMMSDDMFFSKKI